MSSSSSVTRRSTRRTRSNPTPPTPNDDVPTHPTIASRPAKRQKYATRRSRAATSEDASIGYKDADEEEIEESSGIAEEGEANGADENAAPEAAPDDSISQAQVAAVVETGESEKGKSSESTVENSRRKAILETKGEVYLESIRTRAISKEENNSEEPQESLERSIKMNRVCPLKNDAVGPAAVTEFPGDDRVSLCDIRKQDASNTNVSSEEESLKRPQHTSNDTSSITDKKEVDAEILAVTTTAKDHEHQSEFVEEVDAIAITSHQGPQVIGEIDTQHDFFRCQYLQGEDEERPKKYQKTCKHNHESSDGQSASSHSPKKSLGPSHDQEATAEDVEIDVNDNDVDKIGTIRDIEDLSKVNADHRDDEARDLPFQQQSEASHNPDEADTHHLELQQQDGNATRKDMTLKRTQDDDRIKNLEGDSSQTPQHCSFPEEDRISSSHTKGENDGGDFLDTNSAEKSHSQEQNDSNVDVLLVGEVGEQGASASNRSVVHNSSTIVHQPTHPVEEIKGESNLEKKEIDIGISLHVEHRDSSIKEKNGKLPNIQVGKTGLGEPEASARDDSHNEVETKPQHYNIDHHVAISGNRDDVGESLMTSETPEHYDDVMTMTSGIDRLHSASDDDAEKELTGQSSTNPAKNPSEQESNINNAVGGTGGVSKANRQKEHGDVSFGFDLLRECTTIIITNEDGQISSVQSHQDPWAKSRNDEDANHFDSPPSAPGEKGTSIPEVSSERLSQSCFGESGEGDEHVGNIPNFYPSNLPEGAAADAVIPGVPSARQQNDIKSKLIEMRGRPLDVSLSKALGNSMNDESRKSLVQSHKQAEQQLDKKSSGDISLEKEDHGVPLYIEARTESKNGNRDGACWNACEHVRNAETKVGPRAVTESTEQDRDEGYDISDDETGSSTNPTNRIDRHCVARLTNDVEWTNDRLREKASTNVEVMKDQEDVEQTSPINIHSQANKISSKPTVQTQVVGVEALGKQALTVNDIRTYKGRSISKSGAAPVLTQGDTVDQRTNFEVHEMVSSKEECVPFVKTPSIIKSSNRGTIKKEPWECVRMASHFSLNAGNISDEDCDAVKQSSLQQCSSLSISENGKQNLFTEPRNNKKNRSKFDEEGCGTGLQSRNIQELRIGEKVKLRGPGTPHGSIQGLIKEAKLPTQDAHMGEQSKRFSGDARAVVLRSELAPSMGKSSLNENEIITPLTANQGHSDELKTAANSATSDSLVTSTSVAQHCIETGNAAGALSNSHINATSERKYDKHLNYDNCKDENTPFAAKANVAHGLDNLPIDRETTTDKGDIRQLQGGGNAPVERSSSRLSRVDARKIGGDSDLSIPGYMKIQKCSSYEHELPSMKNAVNLKNDIFVEAMTVHCGYGAQKLYAQYWERLGVYLSSSSIIPGSRSSTRFNEVKSSTNALDGGDGIETFLQAFLTTKRLRRLHNKLVLGLAKRSMQKVLSCTYWEHIPIQWLTEVSRRLTSHRKDEGLNVASSRALMERLVGKECREFHCDSDAWHGGFCFSISRDFFGAGEKQYVPVPDNRNGRNAELLPDARIPGTLEVGPSICLACEGNGLAVTDHAIWLLVIALRQHVGTVLRKAVDEAHSRNNTELFIRQGHSTMPIGGVPVDKSLLCSSDISNVMAGTSQLRRGSPGSSTSRMAWEMLLSLGGDRLIRSGATMSRSLELLIGKATKRIAQDERNLTFSSSPVAKAKSDRVFEHFGHDVRGAAKKTSAVMSTADADTVNDVDRLRTEKNVVGKSETGLDAKIKTNKMPERTSQLLDETAKNEAKLLGGDEVDAASCTAEIEHEHKNMCEERSSSLGDVEMQPSQSQSTGARGRGRGVKDLRGRGRGGKDATSLRATAQVVATQSIDAANMPHHSPEQKSSDVPQALVQVSEVRGPQDSMDVRSNLCATSNCDGQSSLSTEHDSQFAPSPVSAQSITETENVGQQTLISKDRMSDQVNVSTHAVVGRARGFGTKDLAALRARRVAAPASFNSLEASQSCSDESRSLSRPRSPSSEPKIVESRQLHAHHQSTTILNGNKGNEAG